jgi:hypothetical protein
MKKTILFVAVMLTLNTSLIFANTNPGPNEEVEKNFRTEFAGAESVVWGEEEELFKARFKLNGFEITAFFNTKGELLGSYRSVAFTQLPLGVISSVNKKFAGAAILEVYEISNCNGTSYRITAQYEGKKIRFKSDASGSITDKEKIKI